MTYSELMAAYREYCTVAHVDSYWTTPYRWSPWLRRPPIEWPSRGPLSHRIGQSFVRYYT